MALARGSATGVQVQNALAGALILVLSACAIREGLVHEIGMMARIGPGFFPLMLGVVLAGLGVAVLFVPETSAQRLGDMTAEIARTARPLLFVSAGVAAFALLIDRSGLLPATFATVVLGSFGNRKARLLPVLLLGVGLAVLAALIFRVGLGMHMPLLRGL